MNTYQAKRLPLKDILAALALAPVKEVRGELWYLSPFRAESEPSFKINLERNIWYDFGLGAGGNVIDFAMQYGNVSTVGAALGFLDDLMGGTLVSPSPPQKPRPAPHSPAPADDFELREIKPLENKALIYYLRQRAIPLDLAREYLQEIHYARAGKPYFALAFQNRSEGYELRNPYYKGSHGIKDISLVAMPEGSGVLPQVAVFEGFMDFLSALAYSGKAAPTMPVLVLNSVSLKDRATEFLLTRGVETAFLYFDHDAAGRGMTEHFKIALAGTAVIDQSSLYIKYKDFNAFLISHRMER